jgi:hypothetical protein
MKNWKTTLAGLLIVLGAAATQGAAMLDGNPATVANWNLVLAAVPVAFGFIFAGDAAKKAA